MIGLAALMACADTPPAATANATATADGPVCVGLPGGHPSQNHLQPFELAIDATRRRAWSTALGTGTLAEVDLDTGALVRTVLLAESALVVPDLAVGAGGVVWIAQENPPAVLRYDPVADALTRHATGLDAADTVVPTPGGGAVFVGVADGVRTVVVVDGAGNLVTVEAIPDAGGLLAMGERVGIFEGATLAVRALPGLAVEASCALPLDAVRGAVLDDGRVVVADGTGVGLAGCDGEDAFGWTVGVENKDVLAWGGRALVLDRIGPDDPNLGFVRTVDAAGPVDAFPTAKNSGFGALDPVTGLLWLNSEGTAEVWAVDPTDGAVVHAVRTGAFVDGLAADPSDAAAVYATGRLSDTVAHVVDGAVVADTHAVRWPYAPLVDEARGRLWVLSQTEAAVVGLDLATLEVTDTIDLGVGPNPLLTFGTVALDADTGRLWVAESAADLLLEVDPDAGTVTASWDLGGPAVEDPDAIGELLVRVAAGGVYVFRTHDGRLQRLNGDVLTTVAADQDLLARLAEHARLDVLQVTADTAWAGGGAFDATTLARLPDRDLDVSRLVGGDGDGGWLALASDEEHLVRLTADGEERGALAVPDADDHATTLRAGAGVVWMGRPKDAEVCAFPVADLE